MEVSGGICRLIKFHDGLDGTYCCLATDILEARVHALRFCFLSFSRESKIIHLFLALVAGLARIFCRETKHAGIQISELKSSGNDAATTRWVVNNEDPCFISES